MKYAVIATGDDTMDCRVCDGANRALETEFKFREAGFETIKFTDGVQFLTRTQMEAMTDASRS